MKKLLILLFLCNVLFAAVPMCLAFDNFRTGMQMVQRTLEAGAYTDASKLCREALDVDKQRKADAELKGLRLTDSQVFQLELMAAVLETKGDFKKMNVPKNDLSPEESATATYAAAKVLNAGMAIEYAQFLASRRERDVPRYDVTFLDEAPRSVAAWRHAPLIRDASKRESRFERYDRKAAAGLIYDVNLVRNLEALPADDKPCPVSFFVAADPRAIYIYIETRDEQASEVFAGLASGGMYEMYIQPGFDECYYQWLVTLSDPPTHWSPTWSSPHKHYRLFDDYMTYEIAQIEDGIGILTTIPWACLYDKLPDAATEWALGIIPWIREGGFTWGSGQVHEPHKFGRLTFKGIEKYMPEIKRWLVLRSWSRYQKQIIPLKTFWSDDVRGDPQFEKTVLLPYCATLEALGRDVAIDMPAKTVEKRFLDAVPQWREIEYMIDERRAKYLKEALF